MSVTTAGTPGPAAPTADGLECFGGPLDGEVQPLPAGASVLHVVRPIGASPDATGDPDLLTDVQSGRYVVGVRITEPSPGCFCYIRVLQWQPDGDAR